MSVFSGRPTRCQPTISARRMRSCSSDSTATHWSSTHQDKPQSSCWTSTKDERSTKRGTRRLRQKSSCYSPGARFSKSPEKSFKKLRPANSVKLVFSNVVKRIKIKTTAKFRASRRLRYEDTKRIMSPEMRPKSFPVVRKVLWDKSLTTGILIRLWYT